MNPLSSVMIPKERLMADPAFSETLRETVSAALREHQNTELIVRWGQKEAAVTWMGESHAAIGVIAVRPTL